VIRASDACGLVEARDVDSLGCVYGEPNRLDQDGRAGIPRTDRNWSFDRTVPPWKLPARAWAPQAADFQDRIRRTFHIPRIFIDFLVPTYGAGISLTRQQE
jgi:hypothetical protein